MKNQKFFKLKLKSIKILLIFCIILFPFVSNAQIIIDEDFSSGLPSGWTLANPQGTNNWIFQSNPVFSSESGGQYAVFDDFVLGSLVSPNEATLTTPSFDCTGRTNVSLKFNHYWEAVEYTLGYVEVWDGSAWNTVETYTVTTGSLATPDVEIIDISANAAGNSDVQVRFRYTDGDHYGRYWYLDDVKIYSANDVGMSCNAYFLDRSIGYDHIICSFQAYFSKIIYVKGIGSDCSKSFNPGIHFFTTLGHQACEYDRNDYYLIVFHDF